MMDATGLDNSSTKGSGRRRSSNLVLRPAFQWKYTVAVVLGVFLVSAFIGIELFGVLYQQARARVLYQPTVNGAEIRTAILLSTLAFALLPAVGFGVWAMFVTHRICGPLEVMEHCLNELKRGRFPKHRSLRKRDEFKDFHDVLWGAIRALEVGKRSELAALANVLRRPDRPPRRMTGPAAKLSKTLPRTSKYCAPRRLTRWGRIIAPWGSRRRHHRRGGQSPIASTRRRRIRTPAGPGSGDGDGTGHSRRGQYLDTYSR